MREYLVFEVWVPIDTPDINHGAQPYRDVVQYRKEEAFKAMEDQLPDEWEVSYSVKVPFD